MLPKYTDDLPLYGQVTFEKYPIRVSERGDIARLGAFAYGDTVGLRVILPRKLGVSAVVLRLNRDGGEATDTPFSYIATDFAAGADTYELPVDTVALCGGERRGLFWYTLLFVRAEDTLFSDTPNNADLEIAGQAGHAFRLLVYDPADLPPDWLGNGVMYHIFVDRFRKGAGQVSYPTGERGAVLDPDWNNGVPPYAKERGGMLANNTFFGGNLWGIIEKIPYLESLGVTVLYISPIFKAYTNHKYDTGDYRQVDEEFGGEAAFDALLTAAHGAGMKVILDGVFNHTGDDSRYFNRYGTYNEVGAAQSADSPYRDWYSFRHYPDEYECWWGIPVLPKLNHGNPDCRRFFTGEDGVGAYYVRRGIDGWRLDVADELNDAFLDEFHESVRAAGADRNHRPVIIGEVWENAADKIAYGHRRRYLQGGQLDSVMNYPVRSGILAFVQDGDADFFCDVLTELYASYPRPVLNGLMNLLGTHDTERILTVLGSTPGELERSNDELAHASLSPDERSRALRLVKIASVLQFTVCGIPSVYYGDEVGLEGCRDPFCRKPFPWDSMEEKSRTELLTHYRALGALRKHPALCGGDFRILTHGTDWLFYKRENGDDCLYVAVNRGTAAVSLPMACDGRLYVTVGDCSLTGGVLSVGSDGIAIICGK